MARYLVKHNVARPGGSGEFFPLNKVVGDHELKGCKIGWLVKCGAIVPVESNPAISLVGDDPTKTELLAEVDRLQKAMESLATTNEELTRENEELKSNPIRREPQPELPQDVAELRDKLNEALAGIEELTVQRDQAQQRADQYLAHIDSLKEPADPDATPIQPTQPEPMTPDQPPPEQPTVPNMPSDMGPPKHPTTKIKKHK